MNATPDHAKPTIGLADLDETTRAYATCALWASTDNGYFGAGDPRNNPKGAENGGSPLDQNFDLGDIHPDSLVKMARDVASFRAYCGRIGLSLESLTAESIGHDFWLTRNGHGTGFWDRGYDDELGDRLTDAAHSFGSSDLYIGDDGKVHVS